MTDTVLPDRLEQIARVFVAKGGTIVQGRQQINLIEGTNVALTVADSAVNERVDVTFAVASAAPSGTAGGELAGTYPNPTIVAGAAFEPGMEMDWPMRAAPSGGWLMEYGQAVSRTTYADLFSVLVPTIGTFTVTIASPGVVTLSSHGFYDGDAIYFTTTGALPTGLSVNTIYYVKYVDANTFQVSASRTSTGAASTAINTSGSQSGTHTCRFCPYGLGDGSTTFNVPDSRGVVTAGLDNIGGSDRGKLSIANALGFVYGEQDHALIIAELAAHTHTQNSHNHTQDAHTHSYTTGAAFAAGVYPVYTPQYATPINSATTGSTTATNQAATATNQNTGSDTAHNTMQPTRLTYKIIKT